MSMPFAVQPRGGADVAEQCHRSFFEQAGADTAQYIVRRLAFQDDILDPVRMQ